MKTLFSLVALVALAEIGTFSKAQSQSCPPPFKQEHWDGHLGVFASDTGNGGNVHFGSAFVYGPDKLVVTCAHVVVASVNRGLTNWIFATQNGHLPLQLFYYYPRYDFAVFKPKGEIKGDPMVIGDFKKLRPGDRVLYYGLDTKEGEVLGTEAGKMQDAKIAAVGSTFVYNGAVADFIEFEGQGIPGYSGGPVFNDKAELVAFMREAWKRQGIHSNSPVVLFNRAFSLDILSFSQEPALTSFPVPVATNTTLIQRTNNAK